MDFSSDKILESYACQNSIDWSKDGEVYCQKCGKLIEEESPYCTISDCPYREEEDLDESEEY